jgi:hypothetical protein
VGQLRERMRQDLTIRRMSRSTQESYITYAGAFVAHFERPASSEPQSPRSLRSARADHHGAWSRCSLA